jgi:hypothetical protein
MRDAPYKHEATRRPRAAAPAEPDTVEVPVTPVTVAVSTVPNTTVALIERVMLPAVAGGGTPREIFARALGLAAAETGDAALRRGERAVRLGAHGRGRPPLDVSGLLSEIDRRVAAGEVQDRVESDVAERPAAIEGVEPASIKRRLARARARTKIAE